MGIIHLLPEHEIHKIAAGEVVERPASVVKELLENALDAGANSITITVKEGGKKTIRIIDNGCGMTPEDAHISIKNHATSKISSVDDLETITTFGFRGEALASIAAISRLTIKTREQSNETGIQLVIDGGTCITESIVACPVGTDITVEDLFFNVPARQKFLKKDETEWRAIQQLVTTCALQHENCSFSLYHNERQTLHAPAVATSIERMSQLLGAEIARDLVTCQTTYSGFPLEINGILAKPTHHRYDKNHIFVFVNRRPVKNHKLIQALVKGYNNILPIGQNPIATLFITIDTHEIDINIHPRKEEVRFAHPVTVERCIQEMVETALNTVVNCALGATSIPTSTITEHATSRQLFSPARPWSQTPTQVQNDLLAQKTCHDANCNQDSNEVVDFYIQNVQPNTDKQVIIQEKITDEKAPYQLIGQAFNTYIVIESDDNFVLIDQHAAHECVLFELFENRFTEQTSTQLIFPLIINLSHDESIALTAYLAAFHNYGIDIEPFGSHAFTIRSVPVYLKNAPFENIIRTFISWIDEERPISTDDFSKLLNEKLRALMACKAAIKAGDRLTISEMHELITKLMACERRTTCPHGRPTTHTFSKHEIEKIFQRCS